MIPRPDEGSLESSLDDVCLQSQLSCQVGGHRHNLARYKLLTSKVALLSNRYGELVKDGLVDCEGFLSQRLKEVARVGR